jgi:hypothetical protein
VDFDDLPARRQKPDFGQPHQPLGRLGQGTEAIAQLLTEIIEPLQAPDARQAAIDLDLLALTRHIFAGQHGGPGQLDVDFQRRPRLLFLEKPHRVFQELAIKLIPYRGDVAALLGTQDVAGAAYLQVAHGDLETGP